MLVCRPVVSPLARLLTASVLLSSWLVLLFVGWTLGGAVYLLLLAAVLLFPWRQLRS